MYEKFLKTLKIILLLTIFQIYLISCMSGGNQQIDEQITQNQKQEQQGQEDQEQQGQEDQDGEEQQEDDSGELSEQNNFSNEQETKNAQKNNLSNNYQDNNNLSNYENQETTDMLNDVSGDNNISMNEGEQQNIQNNNLLGNDQNLDLSQQTTQSGQDSSLENQNMSFGNNLESEQNIGLMDNPQNSTVDNQMGSSDLSTNSFSSGEGESDPLPSTDGIDALSDSATNESSNESSGILQETAQSDQTDLSNQNDQTDLSSQNMSNQPIKVILPENGTKIIYITETSTNLKELANLIYGDKFASTKLSVNTHSKVISPGTSVEYVLDDASKVFAMSYEGAAFKSITVNSQDSLIKISQNNFGDSNKWKYLWKNNLDLIKRPDNIEIGSLIVYKDFSKSNNLSAYQNTSLSYVYNWIYNKNLIAYNRFRYLFANLII
jgi:hypothetical protein